MHSLVHLNMEVKLFGTLDNSSALVFENFMQTLKKFALSGRNRVMQVIHRLHEPSTYSSKPVTSVPDTCSEIQCLSCTPPNNCCVPSDGRCCQLINKCATYVSCVTFSNAEQVYTHPVDSRIIGMHKVRIASGVMKRLPLNTEVHKAMCYEHYSTDYLVFVELLHIM